MKSNKSAFTLFELILVVIILAVVAAVSIPRFKNTYKSVELKQEAKALVYLMRYAQSRAIVKNAIMRLKFDEDFSSYVLKQKNGDEFDESFFPLKGRWGETVKIKEGITLKLDETKIDFYPDGTMERIIIEICNNRSCFTLSTKEQRGYVRLSDKWSL